LIGGSALVFGAPACLSSVHGNPFLQAPRGAVIASNPSTLLADFFASDEMICLESGQPDAWAEGLRRALDDPADLAHMSRRAVDHYAGGHTWRHRFEGILPSIAKADGRAGM